MKKHIEQKSGEKFVGNYGLYTEEIFPQCGVRFANKSECEDYEKKRRPGQNFRLGENAFDVYGKLIPDYWPGFISGK